MWRNGRRNGLKIAVLAISRLFITDQIQRSLHGKIGKICKFCDVTGRRVQIPAFLHKFLHIDATDLAVRVCNLNQRSQRSDFESLVQACEDLGVEHEARTVTKPVRT